MKEIEEVDTLKQKKSGYLQQDLGMLIFLVTLFAGIVMMVYVSSDLKLEFIGMLFLTFLGILFAAYRFTILSVVCGGLQVTIYTAYKLFFYFVNGTPIQAIEFVWLFYPFIAIGSMTLFINRSQRMELLNKVLRHQIDQLVLVDALTGLYNLKCLYLDLETQAALAIRRKSEITLMIIAFRYGKELKKILGTKKFNALKQQVASIVQDSLRIEDKLYAISEEGELAIILTCDADGAEIVKKRIRKALTDAEGMPEIIHDRVIKLDMQIAAQQYDANRFGKDVMRYKAVVESELQYDV